MIKAYVWVKPSDGNASCHERQFPTLTRQFLSHLDILASSFSDIVGYTKSQNFIQNVFCFIGTYLFLFGLNFYFLFIYLRLQRKRKKIEETENIVSGVSTEKRSTPGK
jgi:hypothetical protein